MISSLVIVVVLCGAAVSEDSKVVKILTERKKYEPRLQYSEDAANGYPLIVQQPYPIYVEKRIPYNEEQYERRSNPGVYPSTGEEYEYGPEVVRSPVIFTVSSRPAQRRVPYPMRIQEPFRRSPCKGEDLNDLNEEFHYPVKHTIPKKNIYKSSEGSIEENVNVSERDVPISSDIEQKEGSVQHKETFQSPILIAIEKPGYRYVKHLVGAGVLPKARQFHVLILEEDPLTNKDNNEELDSTDTEQLSKISSGKNIIHEKEKQEKGTDVSDVGDEHLITFPPTEEESKEKKTESSDQDVTTEARKGELVDQTTSKTTTDIDMKELL